MQAYVTLLSAMQVVLNCALELEGTPYMQGKVKQKVNEAINVMNLKNAKNRDKLWKIDDKIAADMMMAIHTIGENIAKCDATALSNITAITRQGVDFSKFKLVEI
jgi:uncharacterized alkaline shock family protein YloU